MNLLAFMGRRLVFLVPTLLGVLAITFLISHIVPGDAAQLIAGPRATAEIIQRIRQDYGLDKPMHIQFGMYVAQIFRGDFGKSILTRRPVIADIRDFFPATFELTTMALFIAVLLGIPLGIISDCIFHRVYSASHLPQRQAVHTGDVRRTGRLLSIQRIPANQG